ncbi:MAG: hypothetical protein OQK58_11525 [Gammaproteobacteria bacterium]|nr:hypothetical protein [Gammaproteobacteria bacterium]
MIFSRQDWIIKKNDTALQLASGKCGGSYAEGIIILSATISAIPAEVWPGNNIDRKRFVEIIINYCSDKLNPTYISIPLLIGYLRDNNKPAEAERLKKKFLDYQKTRVLTATDVDRSEDEIKSVCPDLEHKVIRRFAYPNVFYEEVRSGFAHEYRPSKKADVWQIASTCDDKISYGNWIDDPDRHIHFPVKWIANVAASVAEIADRNASKFPLSYPEQWWLEG